MSRFDPKNRQEAFTYQFEDDVKVMRCAAMLDEKAFGQALETLEIHIKSYHSNTLRKAAKKAELKYKEHSEYVKIHFPQLLRK